MSTYKVSVNKKQLTALVDSGASINFISPNITSQLVKKEEWKRFSPPMILRLADGSARELKYFVELEQIFSNKTSYNFTAVVCNLSKDFDIVLGKRWLKDLSVVQDHGKDTLTIKTSKGLVVIYPSTLVDKNATILHYNELRTQFKDDIYLGNEELLRLQKKGQIDELFMIHMERTEGRIEEPDGKGLEFLKDYPIVTGKEPPNIEAKSRLRLLGAHRIDLVEGSRPIKKQQYRMSPRELEEAERQIKKLMDKGMIRPSSSPWAAPIIFARKKDGQLRMCVDYRALNRITQADSYPIPRIDDNLDRLGGCSVFSIMDLESGFHQLPMDDNSKLLL